MKLEQVKEKAVPVLKCYSAKRAAFSALPRGGRGAARIFSSSLGEESLLDLAGLKLDLEEVLGRGQF